ncbi:uncharacterized protein ANIA_11579 [Aspergillus nidulans FGSC A4]|uniref:Uncharacterized protein n=1 Tax=Emericella nidulans (strain FGSC A4 / ATCC 38163 / CBS 112.46 / NRRL 194 / M139) TaxID=227321 RepID=C8VDY1_EMENI|nr:hypothetical protein [Aspergillus nidulans FGSC A4]CBF80241.1 TPA: hypothetical protein ANIA_11579 [Aspergillus nidulans FGSC A4]
MTAKQQQHDNNRALTPDKHAAKYRQYCIAVSYWLIELQSSDKLCTSILQAVGVVLL